MNCEISEYVYEVVKGMGREDCRLYVSKSTVFFITVYFLDKYFDGLNRAFDQYVLDGVRGHIYAIVLQGMKTNI